MVQQIYSREVLEKFSINQLREICDRLSISRRRSKEDCIVDILAAQPQLVAQAELEAHIEEQVDTEPCRSAEEISPLELNHQGYQDAVAGLPAASDNHSYRMGYDRGLRDIAPIPQEDKLSQAVAFDSEDNFSEISDLIDLIIEAAEKKVAKKDN